MFTEMVLEDVSKEMTDWLDENDIKYVLLAHMVRFRWAGPNVPMNECERQEGEALWFECEEDMVAFKLRWA